MNRYLLLLSLIITFSVSAQNNDKNENERLSIFVREVAIKVEPEDANKWEKAMQKMVEAYVKTGSDKLEWLLYRSQPNEFWIIMFGDSLEDVPDEEEINNAFIGTQGEPEYKEALELFAQTEFEVTRDIVCQQDEYWGTVKAMSTKTHPKARVVDYWVKPGSETEFDNIQQQYVALLQKMNYPYPVEGFRPRIGAPRVSQVVTFPDNWGNYLGINDLSEWVKKMNKQTELDEINNEMSRVIIKSSYHDLDFVKELSSP